MNLTPRAWARVLCLSVAFGAIVLILWLIAHRFFRLDGRVGWAAFVFLVSTFVYQEVKEDAPPPNVDAAIFTARAIREDARREVTKHDAARRDLHVHEKGTPPEWRN